MSKKRSQARRHAVQAIYQWQMAGQDLAAIYEQFLGEQDLSQFEVPYFKDLLHGVPNNLQELDGLLKPALDRAIESVDPVERAVLRLGVYDVETPHGGALPSGDQRGGGVGQGIRCREGPPLCQRRARPGGEVGACCGDTRLSSVALRVVGRTTPAARFQDKGQQGQDGPIHPIFSWRSLNST